MAYHHHHTSEAEGIPLIEQRDDDDDGLPEDDQQDLELPSARTQRRAQHDTPSPRAHAGKSTLLGLDTTARLPTIVVSLTALVLACTLFSALVTASRLVSPRPSPSTIASGVQDAVASVEGAMRVPRKADVERLRRPGLYLGLERVVEIREAGLAFGATYDPPGAGMGMHMDHGSGGGGEEKERVARVSSMYPDTRFGQDGWVFVTETDHTIINFTIPSAPDSSPAVSMCKFTTSFPSRRALANSDTLLTIELDAPPALPNTTTISTAHHPQTTLTLTPLLPQSPPVRLANATWSSTRASIASAIEKRVVAGFGGADETGPFKCPTGEWVLVEVGCEGRGCRVEYRFDDPLGIYLQLV